MGNGQSSEPVEDESTSRVVGKLSVHVVSGEFLSKDDLYVQLCCDDKVMWKTEHHTCDSPTWDDTMEKHVRGDYDNLVFRLMDDDTFSRDDFLGSAELSFEKLLNSDFAEMSKSAFAGTLSIMNTEGESIGKITVQVEYCPGVYAKFPDAETFHE